MKKIIELIKNMSKNVHPIMFIIKYLEDLLIISGLIVIIKATFLLSKIGGMYALGLVLLGLGAYFTKYPLQGR